MGNFLYNKTKLPILPKHDKQAYPYKVMIKREAEPEIVYLYLTDNSEVLYDYNSGAIFLICQNVQTYISTSGGAWEGGEKETEKSLVLRNYTPDLDHSTIWASFNIADHTGAQYIEKTQPVPVPNEMLTGSTGFAHYGKLMLPPPPAFDQSALPYAIIQPAKLMVGTSVFFETYSLIAYSTFGVAKIQQDLATSEEEVRVIFDEPCTYSAWIVAKDESSAENLKDSFPGISASAWTQYVNNEVEKNSGQLTDISWSNYDILYEDYSLFLAGGQPVLPVSTSYAFLMGRLFGEKIRGQIQIGKSED